jgi:hypothetical protein
VKAMIYFGPSEEKFPLFYTLVRFGFKKKSIQERCTKFYYTILSPVKIGALNAIRYFGRK